MGPSPTPQRRRSAPVSRDGLKRTGSVPRSSVATGGGVRTPTPSIQSLVGNKARYGEQNGTNSHPPATSERARVARWIEADRVRTEVQRSARRWCDDSDLPHHVRGELRHPFRGADYPHGMPENG